MGTTSMFAAVSLDGFIAADDDTVGPLVDWYGNGDVAVTFSDEERGFHTTRATADCLRSFAPRIATEDIGRRLFDITNGWNGVPANGEHVYVVTHEAPTDWESAERSRRRATTPAIETSRSPPVRSAAGTARGTDRPGRAQPRARRPRIVQGKRVTHLVYDVRR